MLELLYTYDSHEDSTHFASFLAEKEREGYAVVASHRDDYYNVLLCKEHIALTNSQALRIIGSAVTSNVDQFEFPLSEGKIILVTRV